MKYLILILLLIVALLPFISSTFQENVNLLAILMLIAFLITHVFKPISNKSYMELGVMFGWLVYEIITVFQFEFGVYYLIVLIFNISLILKIFSSLGDTLNRIILKKR